MVIIEIFSILAYCSPTHGALAAFWNSRFSTSNSNILSLQQQQSNNIRSDTRRTVFMGSRLRLLPFVMAAFGSLPRHSTSLR
jgi:hypothetical protein